MSDELSQLRRRFSELASRADSRDLHVATEFLTLAEQDALQSMARELACPFALEGGYDGAERRLAVFGREDARPLESPIRVVHVQPLSQKYGQELGHRDLLGSLMALGIRRGLLGDIVPAEKGGYLYCLASIVPFLCDNLTQVSRTSVRCAPCEAPALARQEPEAQELVVASERMDAMIAAVWRLSRSESQALFAKGLVFVNGRQIDSPSHLLREGDRVSVRGYGRVRYDGLLRETKKGRMRVLVGRY